MNTVTVFHSVALRFAFCTMALIPLSGRFGCEDWRLLLALAPQPAPGTGQEDQAVPGEEARRAVSGQCCQAAFLEGRISDAPIKPQSSSNHVVSPSWSWRGERGLSGQGRTE